MNVTSARFSAEVRNMKNLSVLIGQRRVQNHVPRFESGLLR
jgi:hypothetical protein